MLPTEQTSVNFATYRSYYFQQIHFKLGNFTNLKALFSVVLTDFS